MLRPQGVKACRSPKSLSTGFYNQRSQVRYRVQGERKLNTSQGRIYRTVNSGYVIPKQKSG